MPLNIQLPSLLSSSTVSTVTKILQPLTAIGQLESKVSLFATGLPALLHLPSGAGGVALLNQDAPGIIGGAATVTWGIYRTGGGLLVLQADSVVSFDFKKDHKVSEYPQEGGAFRSYNKVAAPFDVRLRLTKGGKDSDRAAFFDALEAAQASLDLYDIVTPERTYFGASITHIDYKRTAGAGLGLITADVWLTEIRVSGAAAFSQTKAASGSDPANGGNVQPSAAFAPPSGGLLGKVKPTASTAVVTKAPAAVGSVVASVRGLQTSFAAQAQALQSFMSAKGF